MFEPTNFKPEEDDALLEDAFSALIDKTPVPASKTPMPPAKPPMDSMFTELLAELSEPPAQPTAAAAASPEAGASTTSEATNAPAPASGQTVAELAQAVDSLLNRVRAELRTPAQAAPAETQQQPLAQDLLPFAESVDAVNAIADAEMASAPAGESSDSRQWEGEDPLAPDEIGEPVFPPEFEAGAAAGPASAGKQRTIVWELSDPDNEHAGISAIAGGAEISGDADAQSHDSLLDELLADPDPASDEAEEPLDVAESALTALISEMEREVSLAPAEDLESQAAASVEAVGLNESWLVFRLDNSSYGISIRNVLEMDTVPKITPVPNTPDFVFGVINLRGEIMAILDLRLLLGLEAEVSRPKQRILVVRTAEGVMAALVVDEVRGTAAFPASRLSEPAGPVSDRVVPLLAGVTEHEDQLLNVLDIEKVFALPEIRELAEQAA